MSSKIDNNLFSAHEHALEHTPCPKCGGELILKHGKHGPFLGCSQYPNCDYIKVKLSDLERFKLKLNELEKGEI